MSCSNPTFPEAPKVLGTREGKVMARMCSRIVAVPLPAAVAIVCCEIPFLSLVACPELAVPENPWCDFARMQLPIREFAREEVLSRRFPGWSAFAACGSPMHAGEQASICHPLVSPVVLAIGPEAGMQLSLLLHIAIGSAGAYFLAKRLQISRVGAAVAALVVSWGAFPICHLMAGHVTIVTQYALVPWLFLALVCLLESPGPIACACCALLIACLVFAGQPQILYYALAAAGVWAAGSLAFGKAWNQRSRCLGYGLSAVVLGVLVAGVQLVPTVALVRDGAPESPRGAGDYAGTYAMDAADLLRLWFPHAMGNPFTGPTLFDPNDHFHERVVYVGLLAPLLALAGLWRGAQRWQWGAAWLVALALAISLGNNTPALAALGAVVSGLLLFRCPARTFCVATPLLALLAAKGLDALLRRNGTESVPYSDRDGAESVPYIGANDTESVPYRGADGAEPVADRGSDDAESAPSGKRWRGRWHCAAMIWVVLNLAGIATLHSAYLYDWRDYLGYARKNLTGEFAATAFLTLDALFVFWFACRRGAAFPRLTAAAVIGFTALDLGYNNVRNFYLEPPQTLSMPDELLAQQPPIRFVESRDHRHFDLGVLQYSKLVPMAIESRRSLVGTNDGGILPGATMRLFQAITKNPMTALAVASCDYSFARATSSWRKIDGALPRARFVADDSAASALDQAVAETNPKRPRGNAGPSVARSRFGLVGVRNTTLGDYTANDPLRQSPDKVDLGALRRRIAGKATIVREHSQLVEIDVDAPTAGRLVLADTYYPGWKCLVDSVETPIEPAHEVFRAVPLAPGKHTVVFRYEPLSFRVGLACTACGLMGCLGLALWGAARRWGARPVERNSFRLAKGNGMNSVLRTGGLRHGLTLVELLVVVFIIGLLMALVLPAVQSARESARRTQCSNNLKQIGIAVLGYHDSAGTLPISIGPWAQGPNPPPQRNGKGWIVSILPQIEQDALYAQFVPGFNGDFFSGGGLKNPACAAAMRTNVPVLHCPSDGSAQRPSDSQFQWGGTEVTVTSYKGVLGDNRIGGTQSVNSGTMPDCHMNGGCNGLFYRVTGEEPQRLAYVTDGASNTLMIGEDVPEQNYHSAAFYANGDYASCDAPLNVFFRPPTPLAWWNVMSFRSRHSQGAYFCLVDGSVRFINQSIDFWAYRALSTKNGREAVSPPN